MTDSEMGRVDQSYNLWLREHPSALSSFGQMINVAKGKQIVVFLDYDGMLSPIVGDPECAFMTNQMRAAVDNVSNCFHTAIISGRSRKKVYDFVQLKGVFYSGSHGMDTMGPALRNTNNYDATFQKRSFDTEVEELVSRKTIGDIAHSYPRNVDRIQGNEFIIFQPAQHFLPEIKEMLTEVKERTENIPGVKIEDNMFCLSVHYRHVKDEDHERLENQVKSMLANHPDFHFTIGKKVFEIRPSIEWNKGDALNYLLEAFGFHNASKVFPIYIGDDKTDEDAFKVIRERGQGYPIIVSSKPRDTMALYSLKSPSEVQSFLTCLGRWGYDNGAITHHQ